MENKKVGCMPPAHGNIGRPENCGDLVDPSGTAGPKCSGGTPASLSRISGAELSSGRVLLRQPDPGSTALQQPTAGGERDSGQRRCVKNRGADGMK